MLSRCLSIIHRSPGCYQSSSANTGHKLLMWHRQSQQTCKVNPQVHLDCRSEQPQVRHMPASLARALRRRRT